MFHSKRNGNISLVLLTSIVVLLCGSMFLYIAFNGKYNASRNAQRINDRYVAESSVEVAVEFVKNYLSRQNNYSVTYYIDPDLGYTEISSDLSFPGGEMDLNTIKTHCNNYLNTILNTTDVDYIVELGFKNLPSSPQITDLISDDMYLNTYHTVNDVVVSIRSRYNGNVVNCDVVFKDLAFIHDPFWDSEWATTIWGRLNTDDLKIEYSNFKNSVQLGR